MKKTVQDPISMVLCYAHHKTRHIKSTRMKMLKKLQLPIKIFNLHLGGKSIAFTKREYDCLMQIIKGKTAKAAGKVLHISPRTVESYLETIKDKAGCRTKLELIELLVSESIVYPF